MLSFTQTLLQAPAFRSTRRQALTFGEASPFDALDQEIADVGVAINDVRARMAPYANLMVLDREKANEGARSFRAWCNDHAAQLQSLPPDTMLSPADVATLPQDQARAFMTYLYLESVDGYSLLTSGAYKKGIAEGTVTLDDAKADLAAKRKAMQLLTAMDEQGSVAQAFATPVNGLGAFAIPVYAVVLIIVCAFATTGLIGFYYFQSKESERAAAARDKFCDKAREDKDEKSIAECRKSVLNAAAAAADKPIDPINLAILVVGGVGLIYLMINNVLPTYLDRRSSSKS